MQVVATKSISINCLQVEANFRAHVRKAGTGKKKFRSPRNNFWAQGWKSPGAKHGLGPKELFVPRYLSPKPARISAKKLRIIIFFTSEVKPIHSFLLSCFLTGLEPSTSWACCLSLSFVLKLKKSFLLTSTFFVEKFKNNFSDIFPPKVEQTFFCQKPFSVRKEKKGKALNIFRHRTLLCCPK